MLLSDVKKLLEPKYRFLSGYILKDNMPYGFYDSAVIVHGCYVPEVITSVRTCSKEIAAVMHINNVKLTKY